MPEENGGFAKQMVGFVRKRVERETRDFIDAVTTVGFYALLGLSVGLGSVYWAKGGYWPAAHPPADLIFEHLGLGFIVSSVAVFFYEYKAHTKKAIDLSNRLADLLLSRGEEALERALQALIGDDKDKLPDGAKDVSEDCRTVIMTISALLSHDNRVNAQYVKIVSSLMKTVVKDNAQAFRDLSEGKMAAFNVPANAAKMADEVLAAQMRAMKSGDRYEVVSDLFSWRSSQLEEFAKETRKAVGDGVKIRRIFNLFCTEDEKLSISDKRGILHKQLKLFGDLASYQVRLFGAAERRKAAKEFTDQALRELHSGIFILGKEVFKFWVTQADLSEIVISRNPIQIAESIEDFDILWDASVPLSSEIINRMYPEDRAAKGKKRHNGR